MNTLKEIKQLYNEMVLAQGKTGDRGEITLGFELTKRLLATDDLEVVNFHYECLRNQDYFRIYITCRAAFAKRKNIESFLLEKLAIENDTHVIADIIHILGIVRNEKALGLAKEYLSNDDEYMRKVCTYVIGWTGGFEEIDLLLNRLLNETTNELKINAASALRQIARRLKEYKCIVIKALQKSFETEHDRAVLKWVISIMGSIAVKNLGMREDREEPYILHGDLDKAIIKTKKYLLSMGGYDEPTEKI